MKPSRFDSETTPWRVTLPSGLSPDGKRKVKYFRTEKAASDFCRQASKPGFTLAGFVPQIAKGEQDRFLVAARHLASLYNGDVGELYANHDRLKKLKDIKPATVREAIEAFQTWRRTQKLSPSTIDADRWRLNKLIKEFDVVQLVEITPRALREFFDSVPGDKLSIYASASKFFKWARNRGYLAENPLTEIDAKDEIGEYGINNDYYPVAVFRQMIRIAAGLDPIRPGAEPTKEFADMLPYFVLGGFLGLRRCEALRLKRNADSIRWDDLHWETDPPNIEVRIGKTKIHWVETTHYLEAFKAWLPFIPRKGPRIVHWTNRQMQELKRRFTRATHIKFIENGFRNSFATYALTFNGLQGVGKLSVEMGNSEAICKRHYVKNIAPGSGKAWFNLRPFEIVSGSVSATA